MHPPLGPKTAPDEQLLLSDQASRLREDVNILLQIITRAEQQPNVDRLPFRAVFAAYDSVLSENGIEAETDRTYLRFLFQLGGKSAPGNTLYEKFETLLLRNGIRLEYGDETGGGREGIEQGHAADTETNVAQVKEERAGQWLPNGYTPNKGRRSRRASFNSIYDAANETTEKSICRPSSRLSVSRLDICTRASSASPSRRREPPRHAPVPPLLEVGGRMTGDKGTKRNSRHKSQAGATVIQTPEPQRYLDGQHLDRRINHAKPENHIRPKRLSFDSNESSAVESLDSPLQDEDPIPRGPLPPELLYQPSLSHLLQDASTFNMYRQRSALRRIFDEWAARAKRKQQVFVEMQNIAVKHDAATLHRQAFDIWRGALRQKRQESQMERFFRHLEKRASRARDLYLLTKAFTHWAHVTSDEVKRTSAAREHILSIKYFNAWREITAVNEMKAQRFALMKPFKAWKSKFQLIQRNEVKPDAVYRENLIKSAYWKWFWSFCDRRAPQWRDYRLKHKSLLAWLRALRTQRELDQEIDSSNRRALLQATFQKCSQKTCTILSAHKRAESQWRTGLLENYFSEWRIRTHLEPIVVRVSRSVDERILRSSLKTWALQARMSRQAREFDRLRIMRNAWTTWNDNLRCLALSARIDERVVLQTLYKWALLARMRLMTRIHELRLKREMFERLTLNSRSIYTRLLFKEEEFHAHRGRELLRSKLHDWREKLALQRRREHVAQVFYAPRLEQETLNAWKNRMQHIAQMEAWAKDAHFYFLMTMCLKQWSTATANSSKKRRQGAYATVRRRIKKNLAAHAISVWRSNTDAIARLERQAVEIDRMRLFKMGTEAFDKWQAETSQRQANNRDAEIYYNRQLVYSYLTRMVGSFVKILAEEEKATQIFKIHVSTVAAAQFRKLSLRIFQIKATIETADALYERNLRKHYRNMLRHWYDKTKRLLDDKDMPRSSILGAGEAGSGYGYSVLETPRQPIVDPWPSVEQTMSPSELGPLTTFTAQTPIPTPGYLNSPSKRAARARALAQVSTTPATPIRTPFAARLRAEQVRTEPRRFPARGRVNIRRSSLGANVRFVDDKEEERGGSDEDGDVDEDEPLSPTIKRSTNKPN
ncbi:uncharacterized protein PADG_00880 [Paracoccidioides brasiliensis Pb18]|uniref:Sfi1 spindle body domain-containing protein n=1 Tax=Paracoccidioides brasiliensis (strain Pb18) TaxID=502780 RepID=C1FYK4_PARBD|nr:uncharacterized protein PADG_00880 [Paracoccidioides brasiliensis Pb18]EEH44591.1 hypothetical protein PADG_00880 [Paracoccidioides brasiliensis Pb18]